METVVSREDKLVPWIIEAARALAATAVLLGSVPDTCPEVVELERRLRLMLPPGGDDTALLNFLAGKGGLEVEPEAVTGRALQLFREKSEDHYPVMIDGYWQDAEFMLARERALREIVGEVQYSHESYNKNYREARKDPHVGDKWLNSTGDGYILTVSKIAGVRGTVELTSPTYGGSTMYDTVNYDEFPEWVRDQGLRLKKRQTSRLVAISF